MRLLEDHSQGQPDWADEGCGSRDAGRSTCTLQYEWARRGTALGKGAKVARDSGAVGNCAPDGHNTSCLHQWGDHSMGSPLWNPEQSRNWVGGGTDLPAVPPVATSACVHKSDPPAFEPVILKPTVREKTRKQRIARIAAAPPNTNKVQTTIRDWGCVGGVLRYPPGVI